MGVILTQDVTDNTRTLSRGFVVSDAESHHAEEDSSMHGLEAVANVWKRAGNNDRHGVVNIRGLHLFLYVDFNDSVVEYHLFKE